MPEEEIDMKRRMKGLLRIIFGRTTFAVLALSAQIGILVWCGLFSWNILSTYLACIFFSASRWVLHILNKKESPEYKISWVIPVLALPVFGALLYLFVELQIPTRLMASRVRRVTGETSPYLAQDPGDGEGFF